MDRIKLLSCWPRQNQLPLSFSLYSILWILLLFRCIVLPFSQVGSQSQVSDGSFFLVLVDNISDKPEDSRNSRQSNIEIISHFRLLSILDRHAPTRRLGNCKVAIHPARLVSDSLTLHFSTIYGPKVDGSNVQINKQHSTHIVVGSGPVLTVS